MTHGQHSYIHLHHISTITLSNSNPPLRIMFDPIPQSSSVNNHQFFSYNNGGTAKFSTQKHDCEGVLQFSPNNSPPLWKNSPNSPKSPSHPLLPHNNYKSLSPISRAQAIERGQWELMEMVKNMPESSYELSLKDLVEPQRVQFQRQDERSVNNSVSLVKVKRQESKKNESFENRGLFLNMVFPYSLKSKKKKEKKIFSGNGKVSPKPEGEKDWWKKRFTDSSDSDRSRTSNNNGSRKTNGCWPFLRTKKGKSVE